MATYTSLSKKPQVHEYLEGFNELVTGDFHRVWGSIKMETSSHGESVEASTNSPHDKEGPMSGSNLSPERGTRIVI